MSDLEWPKQWVKYPKHRKANQSNWKISYVVAWSGGHLAPSQYEPIQYGSDAAVEELEMSCVELGQIIKETDAKRTYLRKMDNIVGACSGEHAYYVWAEWEMSGAVHGRPVSEKYLKLNGITYNG